MRSYTCVTSRAVRRFGATVYGALSGMRGFGDYLVHQGVWTQNPLRWMKADTFPLASMNCESLIGRRVVLTGFSRIRRRLYGGEAMETKELDQEEVVHRSRSCSAYLSVGDLEEPSATLGGAVEPGGSIGTYSRDALAVQTLPDRKPGRPA